MCIRDRANTNLRLRWENSGSGWRIKTIAVKKGQTWVNLEPVSYTHLRAHETVLDLVCRLLLENKKYLIL
mgnify:CR=1 FL=1